MSVIVIRRGRVYPFYSPVPRKRPPRWLARSLARAPLDFRASTSECFQAPQPATRESAIFGRERGGTTNTGELPARSQSRTVDFLQKLRKAFSTREQACIRPLTRSLFTYEIMEHRYFRPVTQLHRREKRPASEARRDRAEEPFP